MGAGARFGSGRLYWGASAIVVLGLALEVVLYLFLTASSDGEHVWRLRLVSQLFAWAPQVWLGMNVVFLVVYGLLVITDDLSRRLLAMALAPMGTGLFLYFELLLAGHGNGLILIFPTIYGYVIFGLPMLAAGIWVAAQVRKKHAENAEQETGSK